MSAPFGMQWLFDFLDAVPAFDLEIKDQELLRTFSALSQVRQQWSQSQGKIDELTQQLGSVKNIQTQLQKRLVQRDWMDPYLVEFLIGRSNYGTIPERTWIAWEEFASGNRFGALEAFHGGINPAGLYWALAHASLRGKKAIIALDKEDVLTADFVTDLCTQLGNATKYLDASLNVYAYEVHKKLKPALKEVSVGADLLLMISGSGLVPDGGLRLIWLQIKQQPLHAAHPSQLDVHRARNAAGLRQLDVLRGIHQPVLGSFCVYALASFEYDFLASIPVDQLQSVDASDRAQCKIDLGAHGVRLQELIVKLSTDASAGSSTKAEDVTKFVENLAENAIIPLTVLSVSSEDELIPSRDLARQVKADWDRRLEAYVRSMSPERKRDLNIGKEGPSMGR